MCRLVGRAHEGVESKGAHGGSRELRGRPLLLSRGTEPWAAARPLACGICPSPWPTCLSQQDFANSFPGWTDDAAAASSLHTFYSQP